MLTFYDLFCRISQLILLNILISTRLRVCIHCALFTQCSATLTRVLFMYTPPTLVMYPPIPFRLINVD